MPPHRDKNEMVLRARALRREMTLPEGMLWQVLHHCPEGLKFRRQHPIGRCVVDFYCPARKLVIEVDGEAHNMGQRPETDARRDAWLQDRGRRILRFAAAEVIKDLNSVVTAIILECKR